MRPAIGTVLSRKLHGAYAGEITLAAVPVTGLVTIEPRNNDDALNLTCVANDVRPISALARGGDSSNAYTGGIVSSADPYELHLAIGHAICLSSSDKRND